MYYNCVGNCAILYHYSSPVARKQNNLHCHNERLIRRLIRKGSTPLAKINIFETKHKVDRLKNPRPMTNLLEVLKLI